MKYNLGCGKNFLWNHVNLDYPELDLNKSFNFKIIENHNVVKLFHVLEHLDNPLFTMKELHNNFNDGDIIEVKLPTYSCDILHKNWSFNKNYFNNICKDRERGDQEEHLYDLLEVKYEYKIIRCLWHLLDWFKTMMSKEMYYKLKVYKK